MWLAWIMHVQANLLDGISNIRLGECEVLQSACKTLEVRGVLNWWTIDCQLGIGVHWSRARFALSHTSAIQDVKHVLPLRKEKTETTTLYVHPQEVVKLTQICHAELLLQGLNGAPKNS